MARARSSAGRSLPTEHAFSAGGVVMRDSAQGRELLLGRRRRDRRQASWSLPKGTPAGDETPAETALREVTEETGLQVRIVDSLGDIRYRFVRDGVRIDKTVRYYLMEPVGGDLADHDHEFEEVRWFGVGEAERAMQFATERDILTRALSVAGLPMSSAV
ncbi:MAG: NUDIX domain-containing protein [Candidatus Limnocylindrales bacterium]